MELTPTIRPEHMARWEELTRAGEIHLYDYDEVQGYYRSPSVPPVVEHGTVNCYRDGCRCDECRAAQREYRTHYRTRVAVAGQVSRHGTVTHYLTGCQEEACLEAGARYRKNGGTIEPGSLA